MSTRSKSAAILASAGILAAGWAVGTANGQTLTTTATTGTATTTTPSTTTTTPSTTGSSGSGSTSSGSSGSTGTSSSSSSSSGSNATYNDGTYTGTTASNRFGTETVTVTISGGAITDVTAQSTVYEQRSQQYVQRAVPTLRSEVLAAQSADVNLVSGATYTSRSYLSSLQSALDEAAA